MAQTSYDLTDTAAGTAARFAMTQFTTEEFFGFWPQLEAMLDSVPHTWRRWTKDSICQMVESDRTQVWGIGPPPKATFIMLTSIDVYPAMRVLTISWGAGTFEDGMLPLIDAALTGYARLNGCEEIEVRGRFGWDRKLQGIGFKRETVVLVRPVPRERMN